SDDCERFAQRFHNPIHNRFGGIGPAPNLYWHASRASGLFMVMSQHLGAESASPRVQTAMSHDPDPVAVAILAKAPVIGTVKTRLAMMLGVDGATALHERFTRTTVENAIAAAV